MGLGAGIGELTKRNILAVWIFVIEGVVVIRGRWNGGSWKNWSWQFLDDVMCWLGSSRAKLCWSEPSKVGMSQLHFGLLF